MTLENIYSTVRVKVIEVTEFGFSGKDIGNCQGDWEGSISEYSAASVEKGSWQLENKKR